MNNISVGSKVVLEIKKMGINGEGIAYKNGLAIFVPGAIEKDTVYAEITKSLPNYAVASIISFYEKSKKRVDPMCPYYEKCGACSLRHVEYNYQLKFKKDILSESLKKYAKSINKDYELFDVEPYLKDSYRTKSSLPFKDTEFGLSLGLFAEGSNHFVLIDECPIQVPHLNSLNKEILRVLRKHNMHTPKEDGTLLYLITRVSSTGGNQVSFVVSRYTDELKKIANEIISELKEVESVSYSLKKKDSHTFFEDGYTLLCGKDKITDTLSGIKIALSPNSFYQLNKIQAEKLYEYVNTLISPEDVVFEGYGGIGILGLIIASKAKYVYSVDFNKNAIKDANENAKINNITNISFASSMIEKALPTFMAKDASISKIVLDPPRSGLSDDVCKSLLDSNVDEIIYISCNPQTLGKNLEKLSKKYNVVSVKPYDFFKGTALVETVCLLSKK